MVTITFEQEGYENVVIECVEVEDDQVQFTFKFGESGTEQYDGSLLASVASDVIKLFTQ